MGCGGSKSTTAVVVPNNNNQQQPSTQTAATTNNNQGSGQPNTEASIDTPNQQQPHAKQPAAATRIIKKVRIKESNELEFFDILSYEEAAKQVKSMVCGFIHNKDQILLSRVALYFFNVNILLFLVLPPRIERFQCT